MKLSFRPHHFLCTLGFQGRGYSPGFIANYTMIVGALQKNEELPIHVVPVGDSICEACPHQGEEGCDVEEKIQRLDARHSDILALKPGHLLTWKAAKARLKERMTLDAFHQACEGCQWKALGVCEEALRNLRDEPHEAKT